VMRATWAWCGKPVAEPALQMLHFKPSAVDGCISVIQLTCCFTLGPLGPSRDAAELLNQTEVLPSAYSAYSAYPQHTQHTQHTLSILSTLH
jgi:hypothetical protein